jgi:lipopolysaccharide export system permease protein
VELLIKLLLFLKLPLIDRYITNELILFFLFSVGLLSSLGVAIGTVSDLAYKTTEYNLPISVAILIFCYKIPEYIAYALPISTLLTTLIIYGRLSSDRELIALGSFGVNIYRLITPALVFSLVVTLLTFLLNELIVPAANYQANLIQNPFIPKTELNLQKKDIFYPEYEQHFTDNKLAASKLKTIYFAEQYQDKSLQEVTIICFAQDKINQIITAKSAQWNQEKQVWDLFKVEINNLTEEIETIANQQFEHKQLPLSSIMFQIVAQERSPEDMNIGQAQKYLTLIRDSGKEQEIARFAVRIQQKYAFPFICFVFALIGSALGSNYSQINKSKGFGLCVGIVFIYYFLGFAIGSLGIAGIISPLVAAWLPNILCLNVGIWLLQTANS